MSIGPTHEITPSQVSHARDLLREGAGLQTVAAALSEHAGHPVLASDIDLALWKYLGVPDRDLYAKAQPKPMF